MNPCDLSLGYGLLPLAAGVIIALGTDDIVATPGARLGDAAPITPLGPLPAAERAKIESPLLAEVTDSARAHGHDERLAQGLCQRWHGVVARPRHHHWRCLHS